MNPSLSINVLVVGGDHHNTLGIIRSLGQKNVNPDVCIINSKKNPSFVLKSKYIKRKFLLANYDSFFLLFKNIYVEHKIKPTIICTSDEAISFIDDNYDFFFKYSNIPNCGVQGKINYLMNKSAISSIAKLYGLSVAEYRDINFENIQQWHFFPCITKPINSVVGSKSEINILKSNKELFDYFKAQEYPHEIYIQKYIEKEFEFQLIGCSIDSGQNVIIPGYTKIIRSTNVTNTGFLEYKPLSELNFDLSVCESLLLNLKYTGLFSIEFIRGKDGIDYFLEINFRNDGNAYSVTASGVNLPYIWLLSINGLDYQNENLILTNSVIIMPEFIDILNVFKRKITLSEWIKDLKITDCFLYYDKSDVSPFIYLLTRQLLRMFELFFKTIFKINYKIR